MCSFASAGGGSDSSRAMRFALDSASEALSAPSLDRAKRSIADFDDQAGLPSLSSGRTGARTRHRLACGGQGVILVDNLLLADNLLIDEQRRRVSFAAFCPLPDSSPPEVSRSALARSSASNIRPRTPQPLCRFLSEMLRCEAHALCFAHAKSSTTASFSCAASSGFEICIWKPAERLRLRFSSLTCAVSAAAGIHPPRSELSSLILRRRL